MTTTQFEIDNALMAGLAYQSSRDRINWFPAPSGWVEFSHVPNSTYSTTLGFEASAFQNSATGEIVISYAGTNPTSLADWIANLTLGTGFSSSQLEQAALYYLQVKSANPTASISFTGHSLGGGLAALMGVFFDEQAITFDQAPFESSSSSAIRDNLESFLNSNGYSDSLLTTLVPEFMSYGDYGTRTANVTGYYVEGEALQLLQPLLGVIGTQTPLSQSSVGLDILGLDLHSQTLLTAFLLNDDFRDLSFELPSLLQAMFDEGLYAENTATDERNFLDDLLRHQIGVAADPVAGLPAIPANAMLDRFVVDLQQLTPDTSGTAAGADMAKALTVFAMEYHYLKETGATQAFTFADYGLHFKYSDIGASSYKSLPKLAAAVEAYLTPEERALLTGKLVKQDGWHIQSGAGGMTVHGDAGNDALVGGTNADGLWGGGGSDILSDTGLRIQGWQAGQLSLAMSGTIAPPATTTITGADGYSDGLTGSGGADHMFGLSGNDALDGSGGDDILDGGLGDDFLAGGAGSDLIYGGAGRDMILSATGLNLAPQQDRNHDGILDDWAPPAGAGAVWTSGRLWGIYADNRGSETIEGGGSTNPDNAGDIAFGEDGDDKIIGGLGDDYLDGGHDNDILWGHGGNDVLDGGADNDEMHGGGGDDILFGGTGNDLLWGDDETIYAGAGNDVVQAGGGKDYVEGGMTNKLISEEWRIAA